MDRGDVFHVDLDPVHGREQAGAGYVMIVSPKAFNVLGTPLVCPITQGGSFARHAGFAVSLSGAGTVTQGVVLCNQPRGRRVDALLAAISVRQEEMLDRLAECLCDFEGQRQAGVVFFRLDGIHGLPRYAEPFGKFGLRPAALGSLHAQLILHQYRRATT